MRDYCYLLLLIDLHIRRRENACARVLGVVPRPRICESAEKSGKVCISNICPVVHGVDGSPRTLPRIGSLLPLALAVPVVARRSHCGVAHHSTAGHPARPPVVRRACRGRGGSQASSAPVGGTVCGSWVAWVSPQCTRLSAAHRIPVLRASPAGQAAGSSQAILSSRSACCRASPASAESRRRNRLPEMALLSVTHTVLRVTYSCAGLGSGNSSPPTGVSPGQQHFDGCPLSESPSRKVGNDAEMVSSTVQEYLSMQGVAGEDELQST